MEIMPQIEEINVEAEIKAAETYRYMEEHKIKNALALTQWEDLQTKLEGERDKLKASYPMQLAIEKEGNYEITVANLRNGISIPLRYDPNVPCIHVNAGGKMFILGFRVAFDTLSVEFMEGNIPLNIRDIAVNLTRRIL